MRQQLRDYQERGLARILDAYKAGARRVLAVSPTGSGKTTLFGHLTAELRCGVLILVHRRELASQAANRLTEFGVEFGFMMAGERERPAARVQIASVQSLVRRGSRRPRVGLVIPDEAHLSTAQTWNTVLGWYPEARVLGATATPWRLGGKPLIGAYDTSIVVATPRELREQGHLCPYVGFSYKAPDLELLGDSGEDFDAEQSAAAMSALAGDIVEQWLAHARELSTVVFACTVEHSQQLTQQFLAAGVRAEHLDGSTRKHERKAILARVEAGTTQVLCNVGVAVEGLDIPRLKCCVLARPTKSLARAIQMAGRVRRPWRGVTARIHDHAFVIGTHGQPDDDRDYSLHAKKMKPEPISKCKACLAYKEPGQPCMACGAENESQIVGPRAAVEVIEDAEQYEFDSDAAIVASIPQTDRAPVVINWPTKGRVVEGIFMKTVPHQTPYGLRQHYMITGANRTYQCASTAQLDKFMGRVKAGSLVRITYTNDTPLPGGRHRKEFDVEVDQP